MSAEEYEATKKDTVAQLEEFQASLEKMAQGNMTLHSQLDATRLALRSAISGAFKTPEVIRLFANKQPAALRRRLAEVRRVASSSAVHHHPWLTLPPSHPPTLVPALPQVDRDVKLGKISFDDVAIQASEILVALKKLGEPLSSKEESFLQQHMSQTLSAFEEVEDGDSVARLPPSM